MSAGDWGDRYVLKLRTELEEQAVALFSAPSDRERIKSVMADLAKTSSDFKHIAAKALDHLSSGIVPRLRCAASPHRERAARIASGRSFWRLCCPWYYCYLACCLSAALCVYVHRHGRGQP